MPFQDTDEVSSVPGPRTPSRAERLMRKIFIEDWNLKLLALGITLALWFLVTSQNTPVNTVVSVQLRFIRPTALEISNDPPKSVDVLLTGSKHKLDALDRSSLVATVDISDQRPGERVLRLADRAQIQQLPEGLKIDAFQPSAISVYLETVVDKQIPVETKLEGTPAEGYEIYGVRPSKASIQIHGPASHVKSLTQAPTETISVSDRKESFKVTNLAINISDPKVDILDQVVDVEIEIGERRVEKLLSDVEVDADPKLHVVAQRTADVTVLGPASTIAELRSGDIKLRLKLVGKSLQPSLELAPAFQGKVVLKSVRPENFGGTPLARQF